MKKYSWIFALIMALTMAFAFTACPNEPADTTTPPPTTTTPPDFTDDPNAGYTKNASAVTKTITFGTADGETQIVRTRTKGTGTLPSEPGIFSYANGGYTYTYGNDAYGNVILRFKVPLESGIILADYGKVSFKWSTVGYNNDGDNVASSKKLYLLASDDEDAIAPWLDDPVVQDLVVSTSYFSDYAAQDTGKDPGKFWAANSPAPVVNGNAEQLVEIPIIATKAYFENDVWISIYVHAAKGSYTVKDVKLVAGNYVPGETTNPGENAPDVPTVAGIPEGADSFALTIADNNYTNGINTAGVAAVVANADGSISATFDTDLQVLIIKLSEAQTDKLLGRAADSDFYFVIDGEVAGEGTNLFRYFLGKINTGLNWNGTGGSGTFALEEILTKSQTYLRGEADEFGYFVFMRGGGANIPATTGTNTVTIKSINIGVMPGPKSAALSVSVGGVAQTTEIKAGTSNTQSVKAITDGYSMHHAGNGYQNVLSYFKVDLGSKKLEDFSKVTLTWKGIFGDATRTKNLFLLASKTESDLFSSNSLSVKPLVVSIVPPGNLWDDLDGVPQVNGTDEIDGVELLLATGDDLTGEVWFSIYMNASNGAYSVTNIKFVGKGDVDETVTSLTIGGLKPVRNMAPVTSRSDTQYNVAIVWTETDGGAAVDGKFGGETGYTATITLTAKSGYTFDGVAEDAVIVTGADSATNPAGDSKTLVVTAEFPDTAGPPPPGVVWEPTITATTGMNSGGEYIGNTGIQRGAGASELTLTPIENGFTATVTSGSYKQINIQVGKDAGGTDYYTSQGFVAETGVNYKITFNASVTTGTGQLRAAANGGGDPWDGDFALTTTPTKCEYSWTQGTGNFKFDTGSTGTDNPIIITDIVIEITP